MAHKTAAERLFEKDKKSLGLTHEVKPSTDTFFQMFLLWKSSWKDKWGLEAGANSDSSSAAGEQRQASLLPQRSVTQRLTFPSWINTSLSFTEVTHRRTAAGAAAWSHVRPEPRLI